MTLDELMTDEMWPRTCPRCGASRAYEEKWYEGEPCTGAPGVCWDCGEVHPFFARAYEALGMLPEVLASSTVKTRAEWWEGRATE